MPPLPDFPQPPTHRSATPNSQQQPPQPQPSPQQPARQLSIARKPLHGHSESFSGGSVSGGSRSTTPTPAGDAAAPLRQFSISRKAPPGAPATGPNKPSPSISEGVVYTHPNAADHNLETLKRAAKEQARREVEVQRNLEAAAARREAEKREEEQERQRIKEAIEAELKKVQDAREHEEHMRAEEAEAKRRAQEEEEQADRIKVAEENRKIRERQEAEALAAAEAHRQKLLAEEAEKERLRIQQEEEAERERQRLEAEEAEWKRQQALAEEAERERQRLEAEEAEWKRQQALAEEAERERIKAEEAEKERLRIQAQEAEIERQRLIAEEAERQRKEEQERVERLERERIWQEEQEAARIAAEKEQERQRALAAEEAERLRLAGEMRKAQEAEAAERRRQEIAVAEEAERVRLALAAEEKRRAEEEAERARRIAEEEERLRREAAAAEEIRIARELEERKAAEEAEAKRKFEEEQERIRLEEQRRAEEAAAAEAERLRLEQEEAEKEAARQEQLRKEAAAAAEAERVRLEEEERAAAAAAEAERLRLEGIKKTEAAALAAAEAEAERIRQVEAAAAEAERVRQAEEEAAKAAAAAEQAAREEQERDAARIQWEAELKQKEAEERRWAAFEAEKKVLEAEAEADRRRAEAAVAAASSPPVAAIPALSLSPALRSERFHEQVDSPTLWDSPQISVVMAGSRSVSPVPAGEPVGLGLNEDPLTLDGGAGAGKTFFNADSSAATSAAPTPPPAFDAQLRSTSPAPRAAPQQPPTTPRRQGTSTSEAATPTVSTAAPTPVQSPRGRQRSQDNHLSRQKSQDSHLSRARSTDSLGSEHFTAESAQRARELQRAISRERVKNEVVRIESIRAKRRQRGEPDEPPPVPAVSAAALQGSVKAQQAPTSFEVYSDSSDVWTGGQQLSSPQQITAQEFKVEPLSSGSYLPEQNQQQNDGKLHNQQSQQEDIQTSRPISEGRRPKLPGAWVTDSSIATEGVPSVVVGHHDDGQNGVSLGNSANDAGDDQAPTSTSHPAHPVLSISTASPSPPPIGEKSPRRISSQPFTVDSTDSQFLAHHVIPVVTQKSPTTTTVTSIKVSTFPLPPGAFRRPSEPQESTPVQPTDSEFLELVSARNNYLDRAERYSMMSKNPPKPEPIATREVNVHEEQEGAEAESASFEINNGIDGLHLSTPLSPIPGSIDATPVDEGFRNQRDEAFATIPSNKPPTPPQINTNITIDEDHPDYVSLVSAASDEPPDSRHESIPMKLQISSQSLARHKSRTPKPIEPESPISPVSTVSTATPTPLQAHQRKSLAAHQVYLHEQLQLQLQKQQEREAEEEREKQKLQSHAGGLVDIREILKLQTSEERIKAYNSGRKAFAEFDTGLTTWVVYTQRMSIGNYPDIGAGVNGNGYRGYAGGFQNNGYPQQPQQGQPQQQQLQQQQPPTPQQQQQQQPQQ
ncbi:hypothetical protein DFH27DRAFT_557845, partial [Peziza echinospora]